MNNLMQLIRVIGPKMIPFIKTVTLFFLLDTHRHHGQVWSSLVKIGPIISLIIFVLLYGVKFTKESSFSHKIILGLIFSSVGDVFLNLEGDDYFPFGMMGFAVAQIFYISAFGFKPLRLWIGICIYVIAAIAIIVIHKGILDDPLLLVGLPIYSLLLTTMCWRAIARINGFNFSNTLEIITAIGAVLFVISDAVIAFSKFYTNIPNSGLIIMSTYYAAQFGIALSVVKISPGGFTHPKAKPIENLIHQTTNPSMTNGDLRQRRIENLTA